MVVSTGVPPLTGPTLMVAWKVPNEVMASPVAVTTRVVMGQSGVATNHDR
jgi:hypothetical protein